jgi:hypothetical protein
MTILKFLKDADGTVMVRIKENSDGQVIEVVTYNDCKQQKWQIIEEKTEYETWITK